MLMKWLIAFLVTLSIEALIYSCPPFQAWFKQSASNRLRVCLLANLSTHPLIFLVLPNLVFVPYWEYVAMAELIALFGEWHVLSRFGVFRPFAVSLFANLCSWQLGGVLVGLFAIS